MSDDLVERLRNEAAEHPDWDLPREAADEIEALRGIVREAVVLHPLDYSFVITRGGTHTFHCDGDVVRRALEGDTDE